MRSCQVWHLCGTTYAIWLCSVTRMCKLSVSFPPILSAMYHMTTLFLSPRWWIIHFHVHCRISFVRSHKSLLLVLLGYDTRTVFSYTFLDKTLHLHISTSFRSIGLNDVEEFQQIFLLNSDIYIYIFYNKTSFLTCTCMYIHNTK